MNSGLPSLLDAIFGKQDLATISVDELYEVINEFPSFNAAHFLLSKKLKQENDADYDKESMRTALYFNNSFWLQTLLDEGNKMKFSSVTEEKMPFGLTDSAEPGAAIEDELDYEVEEILDEKTASEAIPEESDFRSPETDSGTIDSYEDFVTKYNIEIVEPVKENNAEIKDEDNHEIFAETPFESRDTPYQRVTDTGISEEVHQSEQDSVFGKNEEDQKIADRVGEQFEIREEVINDYGIFEEIKTKKYNHDLESFDAIFDEAIAAPFIIPEETIQVEDSPIVERPEENSYDAARTNDDPAGTNDMTSTNDDTIGTNDDTIGTNDDTTSTNDDTIGTNYDVTGTNVNTIGSNDDMYTA
ncbi:MAG: hypothetical protein M3N30_03925, partial [Bacteroidota bacterium]|nr:hypothetical protein [Bacteroidota bacterium]